MTSWEGTGRWGPALGRDACGFYLNMFCFTSSRTRPLSRKRKEHGRRRPSFQSCRPPWLPYCGLFCQAQPRELEDQHCLNRPNHVHVHGIPDLRSLAVRRSAFKACSANTRVAFPAADCASRVVGKPIIANNYVGTTHRGSLPNRSPLGSTQIPQCFVIVKKVPSSKVRWQHAEGF